MKINLPIEEGYFNITPGKFCNKDSLLITPEADAKWNECNLHLRSLIVDAETKEVLSSGFPKFFNYGEKLDCYPKPEKYNDWRILSKVDGSLLIADYVNDTFSMRTRGTMSYSTQENFKDFELLPQKYPRILDFLKYNEDYSLLFEIVTPNNVIVVRPKDIEFYFLGAVYKETLEMAHGESLVNIWRLIGCPPTPEQYEFSSVVNLASLSEMIKLWKGKEGVVLSYNNGQNRIKLKSDWYCFIHRVKSQLSSINNLVDFYVELKLPTYEEFYKKIETKFDYEIAVQLKDEILKISNAGTKVIKFVEHTREFCNSIKGFESRKQQAEHIIATYTPSNKSSYVFCILDGKELTNIQLNKLIFMELENES